MKLFFIGLGIIAAGGIVWVLVFKGDPMGSSQQPSVGTSGLPVPVETTEQPQTLPNQGGVSGTKETVLPDFQNQIQNANLLVPYDAVVVSNYALQVWGDENKGGEALLKYNSNQGWILVTMGGGAWDVAALVKAGVPRGVAEQLMQGLPR